MTNNLKAILILMLTILVSTSCKKEKPWTYEPIKYVSFAQETLDYTVMPTAIGEYVYIPLLFDGPIPPKGPYHFVVNAIPEQTTAVYDVHYLFDTDEELPFNYRSFRLYQENGQTYFYLIVNSPEIKETKTLTIYSPAFVQSSSAPGNRPIISKMTINLIPPVAQQ